MFANTDQLRIAAEDLDIELEEAYGRELTSADYLQELENLQAAVLTEEEKLQQAACIGYRLYAVSAHED